ncbi:hypothetical protein [Bacteroides sp.]
MKKVNYLSIVWMVFACVLSFSSCADEDNEEDGDQEELSEKLLGHWKQEEREDGYYYCEILTFSQDGVYEIKWREETFTGEEGGTYSYDVSDDKLTLNCLYGEKTGKHTYTVSMLTDNKLVLMEKDGDIRNYSRTEEETIPGIEEDDKDYGKLISGTWTVLMDDPSWKSIVTFKTDGTYTSKDYYDIKGNQTFSELDGSYNGNYIINDQHISIRGETVIAGEYTIESISANSGKFADEDGWKLYLSK